MRKSIGKSAMLAAVVFLLAAGLFACSAKQDDTTIRYASSSVSGVFNPIFATEQDDVYAVSLIFEPLMAEDESGCVCEYRLAKSMSQSDMGKTYTFNLRDAAFSNGKEVTAQDVLFTYECICNKRYLGPYMDLVSGIAGYDDYKSGKASSISGIQVIDKDTISFTFTQTKYDNIKAFTVGILSSTAYAYDNWDELVDMNASPVGAGPYMLVDYAPGISCNLKRNENYYGKKPAAATISFLVTPADQQIEQLLSGAVDIATAEATVGNANKYKYGTAANILISGKTATMLAMNPVSTLLQDINIRKAIAYGVDTERAIYNSYYNLAKRSLLPIKPDSYIYPNANLLDSYAYNADKAAKLLDQSGWKTGLNGILAQNGEKLTLRMLVDKSSTWQMEYASLAVSQLAMIGIRIDLELADTDTCQNKIAAIDSGEDGTSVDLYFKKLDLDLKPGISFPVHEKQTTALAALMKSCNGKLETAQNAADKNAQMEDYKDWGLLVNGQVPCIFIAYPQKLWCVSNSISGFDKMNASYDWTDCIFGIKVK